MLVSASTNGTWATTAPKAPGSRFSAAPTSRPPAEAPRATSRCGDVQPSLTRCARTGHEVGERVDLAEHLAVVVPAAAQLTPAADVRDRVPEPPVQQGQPGDGKAGVDRGLVAAVPVQHERRAAVAGRPRAADQRDRDPGPVRRGRPQPVLLVVGRVVPGAARQGEHRAAPQQGQFACLGVPVVHRVRRDQRAVIQPEVPGRRTRGSLPGLTRYTGSGKSISCSLPSPRSTRSPVRPSWRRWMTR